MTLSLSRLRRDARGATIIEFALVIPVMLLLIMGLCDLAYQGYLTSVLAGSMQKAGRDSTIEGNDTTASTNAIDLKVMAMVWRVAKNATWKSTRKNYAQFGNIAPEPFEDNNNNGVYDKSSECFTDLNGNGVWDTDPGLKGQGGASDVVAYTMAITYPRLFPLARVIPGWSQNQTISVTTTLKNQPYKGQNAYSPTKVCP